MIRQDATIYGATLEPGQSVTHRLSRDRYVYIVPSTGAIEVNGRPVGPRDGAAIRDEEELVIAVPRGAAENAEILFADVPALD